MNRRHRRADAQKSKRVSAPNVDSPAALYEAGLGHLQAGRFLEAQICGQHALAIDGNHADALHLMGMLSFQANQNDHAIEWIVRAIRQDPKADYLANLGSALQRQGRHEEACKAFDKAVQLKPDDAGLWTNLGKSLVDLKRQDKALLSFQHVLKLTPGHWAAANASAVILYEKGRYDEALKPLAICEDLRPEDVQILQLRALCLHGLKQYEEALEVSRRAYGIDPASALTCNHIGFILARLPVRNEEALQWFDKALAISPNFGAALSNKIYSLCQLHRFDETIALYHRLKTIDPANAAWAEVGLGHLNLLMGNFEAGWVGHEARLRLPARSSYYPTFSEPMWRGEEPVDGKTVLVYADEGLGDTIQFARYLPMLAARGARVVLVVQEAARALCSEITGVSECLPKSVTTFPPFDFHCQISALPMAFGTRLDTIPAATSYLPPPPEDRRQAWEERLGPPNRLRVGLVWSGSAKHKNDHNRSTTLQVFSRILDLDATFISLQKDPRPNDRAALLEQTDVVDLTEHLTDFTETAALVTCLDLVITVDSSVAHLAGALGCPTWILLPYVPDWRWLLNRDDSPWYPTVRLFRQTEAADYGMALDNVRCELLSLISSPAQA